MSKHQPVKNPETEIIDKDTAILKFQYPFDGTELDYELVIHRELIKELLKRMDNFEK